MILFPLLLAAAAHPAGPPATAEARSAACVAQVQADPAAARKTAEQWRIAGGGFLALDCGGLAAAAQQQWTLAAGSFTAAAQAATVAGDARAAAFWAQAGNAWLAGGMADKARAALDSALAAGTLTGLPLGEAQLDHARALVAAGDLEDARADLDLAVVNAKDDPLAWLLSATLARRMHDVRRAKADITEALLRSADDASVQLEAGNIAAMDGNETAARDAWGQAARLAPGKPAGQAAVAALRQFGGPAK